MLGYPIRQLSAILFISCLACIGKAQGFTYTTKAVVFNFSANISKKEKANSIQFFNLGVIDRDLKINKVKLSINPNVSYSFATVRLSTFPVEKYGDQESSGWYFIGCPPNNMGTLGSWWPGSKRTKSKEGVGPYPVKKGTYLILEILFNESTKPNRGSVDFKLYKDLGSAPINRMRYFNRFEKKDITIPPLAEFFELSEVYTLSEDIQIHSLKPTLHLRGVSVTMGYIRSHAEGPQVFVNIPNYSFFHYRGYKLKKPIRLRKGNKLWIRGVYNNSFSNFFNPNPLTTVYRGWKVNDEMLRFSYQYYKE